jgi:hypothetical protein
MNHRPDARSLFPHLHVDNYELIITDDRKTFLLIQWNTVRYTLRLSRMQFCRFWVFRPVFRWNLIFIDFRVWTPDATKSDTSVGRLCTRVGSDFGIRHEVYPKITITVKLHDDKNPRRRARITVLWVRRPSRIFRSEKNILFLELKKNLYTRRVGML